MTDDKFTKQFPIGPEGLFLPGDPEDKCCFAIPLKLGVQIIAVLTVLSCIGPILSLMSSVTFLFKGVDINVIIQVVVYSVCLLPYLYASYIFLIWLVKGSHVEQLPKACMFVVLSQLCLVVFYILQMILGWFPFSAVLSMIITSGISTLFIFYFAGACTKLIKSEAS